MISLKTLGAVDLRDDDGHELRSVLQQPKRLALLAYLVLARPGTLHRRDVLLVRFWPELDQEHARGALRRALHFLRQAGPQELILTRGDEEVGVDLAIIACDALAFDEAIAAGQSARALQIYEGDFLEGLYVQGAPAAEAWLDDERRRRRHDAARAAWTLARDAFPDVAAAERWGRRAVELAPDDDDALAQMLEGLVAQGQRRAAARLYGIRAGRAVIDGDPEPTGPLGTLARELGRSTNVISLAPASDGDGLDAALVAVCPFAVSGNSALEYLRLGMVDLISTKLDGLGDLRAADPRAVLRLGGEAVADGTDLATAQAIARALKAGSFVVGALVENAGRLDAGIGLYETGGRLRARAEARADHETGLFELVDELVRRLVAALADGADSRLVRLAALTTSSLPALKAYLHGEHEHRLGRHLRAIDAFRRATAEDGGFGLAHYRLASSLAASALIGPARQASGAAWRCREHLSEHDRLLLEAQHAWLEGRVDEAEARYATLVTSFPEQLEPWFLLGDLLFHANPYRGRSITEAREPLERALAIDPSHVSATAHLARLAALEGRSDELVRLVERARVSSPGADQTLSLRTLRAFALQHEAEQQEAMSALRHASGLVIARAFSDVALYTREWQGAETLARNILPAARSVEFEALGHIMLAHLAMARGRRAQAEHLLLVASRHAPEWSMEVRALFTALPFGDVPADTRAALEAELRAWSPDSVRAAVSLPLALHDGLHQHLRSFLLGLLRARAGDASGVAAEAEALAELSVPTGAGALIDRLARTLDAEALRLRGRSADALARLERPGPHVWFQYAVASPFYAGTYERFLRADLLAELGRVEEALAWWHAVAQRSPFELVFLAEAERRQARVLERRGRLEAARRHRARAEALWTGDRQ